MSVTTSTASPRHGSPGIAALVRILWIVLYIASPIIPLVFYFAGNWSTILHSWSLSMVFGIVAYIWFLNQFIVAARPAYWDRIFGLDRMYRFHGYMAIAAVIASMAHIVLKRLTFPVLTLQQAFGAAAMFMFVTVTVATLFFMVEGRIARLTAVARLRARAASRWRWQYQTLKRFHNLVAPAALLLLLHVLLAFSTLESFGRIAVMAVWFVMAGAFYAWHKIVRPRGAARAPFTVARVSAPAPAVTRLELSMPTGRPFRHRAGQFVYLRFLDGTPGEEEHPFTISSAHNDTSITITAKNLGDFSGDLSAVQPGAAVAIDGPYGIFRADRLPAERPLVLVAGGIGITPFLAMLGDAATTAQRRVHLVWSVRDPAEFFDLAFLEETVARSAGRLSVDLHVTGSLAAPADGPATAAPAPQPQAASADAPVAVAPQTATTLRRHAGRVTVSALQQTIPPQESPAYFLCGPTAMMETLVAGLRSDGVARSQIHFEAFAM